jgi:hypothetical protein
MRRRRRRDEEPSGMRRGTYIGDDGSGVTLDDGSSGGKGGQAEECEGSETHFGQLSKSLGLI